jgi:hypothetical protein
MALGGWGIPPPLASPLYSGGTAKNMLLGEKERQGSIKTLEVHSVGAGKKYKQQTRWIASLDTLARPAGPRPIYLFIWI